MKIGGQVYKSPVSRSIPYDDTLQEPYSGTDNAQDMFDYLKYLISVSASPGFTWGRGGSVTSNVWLLNDSVASNICGRTIFLYNAHIVKVYIANQDATSGIVFGVYEHDGDNNNLSLLGSVTTLASRSNEFDVNWSITHKKQIGIKVENGSVTAKNPVVGILMKGSIEP